MTLGRAHLKSGVALALGAGRVDRLWRLVAGTPRPPLVLGYHRVVPDFARRRDAGIAPMIVSRRMLERQIDWVAQHFRVVSLDELGRRLEAGDTRASRLAAITFDDGYRDVYEHAYPLLRRKGLPAAVFVVSDWVGTGEPLVHDRLYALLSRTWPLPRAVLPRLGLSPADHALRDPFTALRFLLTTRPHAELARVADVLAEETAAGVEALEGLRPLTWTMLGEMQRGGITIGSHTRTHAVLTHEDEGRVRAELTGSRQTLEERLGTRIDHFAYPDGGFTTEVVESVAAAGYRFGYTTCRHVDRRRPWLTIPRRVLWEGSCLDASRRFSPAVMTCLTSGLFDLAGGCRERHDADAPWREAHAAGH